MNDRRPTPNKYGEDEKRWESSVLQLLELFSKVTQFNGELSGDKQLNLGMHERCLNCSVSLC